jgi:glycine cleavage system H protein
MVESVKAASDVYSPVTGEVLEVNPAIVSDPGLVNSDPMGAGWFFKVRIEQNGELTDLMDKSQYREYIKKQ